MMKFRFPRYCYTAFIFLFAILAGCDGPARKGDSFRVKEKCLSAVDERCYAEMTEYTVLRDSVRLQALRRSGKLIELPAERKVTVLKRKVDVALVEYRTRRGRRQVWIAVKHLK